MAARLKLSCFGFWVFILLIFVGKTYCLTEKSSHYEADFKSIIAVSPLEAVTYLLPNVKYVANELKFHVYCFQNVPKSFLQIWRSVQLVMLDIPLNYNIFHGGNESEVQVNYESKSFWSPSSFFTFSDTVIEFPAFSNHCVGITSVEGYSLLLKVRTMNYWKVLQTFLGLFLFLSSPDLSRNSFFHYASAMCVGVLASILILLYILSRFIPQKGASYVALVFGYSFILYFLKMVWHHLHDILTHYTDLVLGYCVVAAFFSFVVCYRIGPVKNERTCNIIQWSMQALSLMLVFFSSEYRELSTAIILFLLSLRMVPAGWIKWLKYLWYKCFPPKVKLLSEIEYIEQGHVETKKALDNLRQHCSSPDCNVWKVVRKLKDPIRFAHFVESGSHYTDQELLDYNSEDFNESPESSISDAEEDNEFLF